jgi:hypothetical protein
MEGKNCGLKYNGTCLERLRKPKANLKHDSQTAGRYLNPELPNTKEKCQILGHVVVF